MAEELTTMYEISWAMEFYIVVLLPDSREQY